MTHITSKSHFDVVKIICLMVVLCLFNTAPLTSYKAFSALTCLAFCNSVLLLPNASAVSVYHHTILLIFSSRVFSEMRQKNPIPPPYFASPYLTGVIIQPMSFSLSRFQFETCSFLSDNLWKRRKCLRKSQVWGKGCGTCMWTTRLESMPSALARGHQPCPALMNYLSLWVYVCAVSLPLLFKSAQLFAKDMKPDRHFPTQWC